MNVTVLDVKIKSRDVIRVLRTACPGWKIYPTKLNYYAKTNLVDPKPQGPGLDFLYSMTDLILLATIGQLLEGGLSLRGARKVVEFLGKHAPELIDERIGELQLSVTTDGDAAWFDPDNPYGENGVSVLKRPGQLFLIPTKAVAKRLLKIAGEEGLLNEAA